MGVIWGRKVVIKCLCQIKKEQHMFFRFSIKHDFLRDQVQFPDCGRRMTLNAFTVDLTETQLHHCTIPLVPNYPHQQEDNTDITLSDNSVSKCV